MLLREIMDEAVGDLQGEELNQFIQATESMLNSLEIAESIRSKDTEDQDAGKDVIRDIHDQMDQHPIFKRYSENARAIVIQKMVNEGKPLASQEELVQFANEKVSKLDNEMLVTNAYDKGEIIRVGRNALGDPQASDSMAYNKGLEVLTEEAIEPDGLVRTKALAVEKMLKNPKELDKLVFEYYEI